MPDIGAIRARKVLHCKWSFKLYTILIELADG
jgi:hypothetical protein